MLFSQRLKELRLEKGYTLSKLAELTDIHEKTLFRYEKGSILPVAEKLRAIADVFGVSADYFLFEHALKTGIPKVNDPLLYDRYLILEQLSPRDRDAAITLLDALVARMKLKELVSNDLPQ